MASDASEPSRTGAVYAVKTPVEFWVWLDPASSLVRHHVELLGRIPAPAVEPGVDQMKFVRNPKFQGSISPFALGITAAYNAEVMLEYVRRARFPQFPSRLNALFLLRDHTTALRYRDIHPQHVANRVLKRVVAAAGSWSAHDASWVDFLRLPQSLDRLAIDYCGHGYWSGVSPVGLISMGEPWSPSSVEEILYVGGSVEVPERDLSSSDQ